MNRNPLPEDNRHSLECPFERQQEPSGTQSLGVEARNSRPIFRAEWHDAKEIVVPFDASKHDVQLVNEKEWAAAYATQRLTPPVLDNLRLETRRTVGRVVRTPGWKDDLVGFLTGVMLFLEILLIVWTAALLLQGFPVSKGLAWSMMGLWAVGLPALRFGMIRSVPYQCILWFGGIATTLAWLTWSPWSQEVLARMSGYFFLK